MERGYGKTYGKQDDESFHTLYLKIIEAFRATELRHDSFRKLSNLLHKSIGSLGNPLSFPGRNSNDLNEVKKGSVTIRGVTSQLSKSMIELVERVSEELELNESECVQLLMDARNYVLRFQNDQYAAAIHLFFSERQHQLLSLLTIIQGIEDDTIAQLLRELIFKVTRKLIKNGNLIENILKRISELNQKVVKSKHSEYFRIERRRLVECLFYASFFIQLGPENVMTTFSGLKTGVKTAQQLKKEAENNRGEAVPNQNIDKEIDDINLIISLSLVCSLDPYRESLNLDEDKPALNSYLVKDSKFRADFDRSLYDAGSWADQKIKGVIHLVWTLCWQYMASERSNRQQNEEYARTSFDNAISHGVFAFICAQIAGNSGFRNRTDKRETEFFVTVMSDLLCNLITYHGTVVQELITNEEELIREHQNGMLTEEPPAFLEDLLLALAAIHKGNPELGSRFWNRSEFPALYYFVVKYCWEFISSLWTSFRKIHSPSFQSFLEFLRSICTNAENAHSTFCALRDSNFTTTNLDFFFSEVIQRFPSESRQAQQQAALEHDQYGYYGMREYSWFDPHIPFQTPVQRFTADDVESILRLVEEIALNSTDSRYLLYQEPQWNLIPSLFDLFSATEVTPSLMGVIMRTLGAFASVPEVAMHIWEQIESKQIIETHIHPTTERLRGGRMKQQLEEVEAYAEEYPESTGFLVLLKRLVENGIPDNIGAPSRPPGFSPYLRFIQDDVFVKHDRRRYKDPGEKWKVANICLEIFDMILDEYVPDAQDFKDASVESNGVIYSVYKRPGYELMRNLLNAEHSPILRKIFSIISTGTKNLEAARFSTEYGQVYEKSIWRCMKLIDTILSKQELFMQFWRSAYHQQGIVLTDLTKLIATDRHDVVVHLARFIGYPHKALIRFHAARVLFVLSQSEHSLASIFASSGEEDNILGIFMDRLRGEFVQYLPQDDMEEYTNDPEEFNEVTIENKLRSVLLDILINNVNSPGHNLTHFLCGYNTSHKPAVIADPKKETCLQVVLSLLQNDSFTINSPKLAEQCYELIYLLAADTRVSSPTLTHLYRIDFLCKQLQNKDKERMAHKEYTESSVSMLNQWAYLLKSVALEIFTSTSMDIHKHQGSIQAILEILFASTRFGEDENELMYGVDALEQHKTQMLELLDSIDLRPTPTPERPSTLLPVSPEDCLEMTAKNVPYYNVEALRYMLIQAYQNEQNRLMEYQPLQDEIRNTLERSIQWNKFYQKYAAIRNAFEGWKQVVEITISQCYEMLDVDTRERILYDIMTSLLLKLASGALSKQLENSISQLILRLMTKLREQRLPMETKDRSMGARLPLEQCTTLLRSIVRCILRDNTSISTRGNLYATLLNYLQYTRKLPVLSPQLVGDMASDAKLNYRAYLTAGDAQDELARENEKLLHLSGSKLIDKISKDAVAGSNVWLAVSFATLDILFSYDQDNQLLSYIRDNGVLQQFLNSLQNQEPKLRALLNTDTVNLNDLYIYESKMSFLEKIASSPAGASELYRHGIIFKLQQFRFMDERPEDAGVMEDEWELPSIVERYHHLLLPLLRLLVAIFSSLRTNRAPAEQLLEFINKHHKVLSSILKDRQITTAIYGAVDEECDIDPRLTLEEVKLVSCLFNLLASHEDLLKQHLSSRISKYRGYLVNILVKTASALERKAASKPDTRQSTMVPHKDPIDILLSDIRSNIIGFCKIYTDYPLDVHLPAQILFTPSFTDLQKDIRRVFAGSGHPPSLNVLAVILQGTYKEYQFSFEARQRALSNLARIDELSPQMLAQIAEHEDVSSSTRVSARHETKKTGLPIRGQEQTKLLAEINLSQSISARSKELDMSLYILENCLVVLWRHLKYFLQSTTDMSYSDSMQDYVGQLTEKNMRLSVEETEKLRRDAKRFLQQVLEELIDRNLFGSELLMDLTHKNIFVLFPRRERYE
eukprot:gb/GECH01010121.1/.p1 GENE.gb/GECH01010121.1/~~gb/GECH01010121.1/.p1  ORF type:complete len:1939 (+),score=446.01 gb/GECH01010121.1/:1-5817(+)